MPRHLTRAELAAALPQVTAGPKDHGELKAIFVRPGPGQRLDVSSVAISSAGGLEGDHWAKGCWKSLPDGSPDPDVQVFIMNARFLDLIAQERSHWASCGNSFVADMDLGADNLPVGTRLKAGSAELEITAVPGTGCEAFIEWYGRDACVFVNTGEGKKNRLRGVYARVVKDGVVRIGDTLTKI